MSILYERNPSTYKLLKGQVALTPSMKKKFKKKQPREPKPDYREPARHWKEKKMNPGSADHTSYNNHRGWGEAEPSTGNYYAHGGYVSADTPQGRYEEYEEYVFPRSHHAMGGSPWGGQSQQYPQQYQGMNSGYASQPTNYAPMMPQRMMAPQAPAQQPQAPAPTNTPQRATSSFDMSMMGPRGFAHGGYVAPAHHYGVGGMISSFGNAAAKYGSQAASAAAKYAPKIANAASKYGNQAYQTAQKIAANPYAQKLGNMAMEHGMPLAVGAMQGGLQSWQNGGGFGEGMRQGAVGAMQQSDNPYMQMAGQYAERRQPMNQMAQQFGQQFLDDSGYGDTQMGRGASAALGAYGQGRGIGQIAQAGMRGSGNQYGSMAADFMDDPHSRSNQQQLGQRFLDHSGYGDTQMGRGARSAMGAYGRGGNMQDVGFEGMMGALPQNEYGAQMGQMARMGKQMYDQRGQGGGGGGMRDQFTPQNAGKYGLQGMQGAGSYLSKMNNPMARQFGEAMSKNYMAPQQDQNYDEDDDYYS